MEGISVNQMVVITLIGFGVGMIGTGIGGLLTFLIKKPGQKWLSFILGASGGVMLAIVCFDLLPEAFALGKLYVCMGGIIAGVGIITWLDEKLTVYASHFPKTSVSQFIKTGILLALAVALHNFPEGLAIGSGFMVTKELGIGLSLVIALHNMPEGISMAAPMRIGGISKFKTLLYTIGSGIPMGFGALIGALLGKISDNLIAFCLAFAGGTMLYITCGQLIPQSYSLKEGKISGYGFTIGFMAGILVVRMF
jgi:ZIP family zinc transporter